MENTPVFDSQDLAAWYLEPSLQAKLLRRGFPCVLALPKKVKAAWDQSLMTQEMVQCQAIIRLVHIATAPIPARTDFKGSMQAALFTCDVRSALSWRSVCTRYRVATSICNNTRSVVAIFLYFWSKMACSYDATGRISKTMCLGFKRWADTARCCRKIGTHHHTEVIVTGKGPGVNTNYPCMFGTLRLIPKCFSWTGCRIEESALASGG